MYAIGLFIVLGLLLFFTMPLWMPRSWYRALLYTGGKPNALSKPLNSAWSWLCSLGILPAFMVSLETTGRRTGKTYRNPMVVAEANGERFLVSMLGENVSWVCNVRAAGGEALLRHGTVEQIRLEEVALPERAPILKAYLQRAPGARPHFDIPPDAPIHEFERVAARYPVFRVLPR